MEQLVEPFCFHLYIFSVLPPMFGFPPTSSFAKHSFDSLDSLEVCKIKRVEFVGRETVLEKCSCDFARKVICTGNVDLAEEKMLWH